MIAVRRALAGLAIACSSAAGEPRQAGAVADLGLSVIHIGYERGFASRVAVAVAGSAGIYGTYFLPWFDLGDNVVGVGIGVRATWFSRDDHRGFYVAPYVRGQFVRGDVMGRSGSGAGVSTGFFLGRVFGLTDRLDLRLGVGAQYIRHRIEADAMRALTSTPFVALDGLLSYRL